MVGIKNTKYAAMHVACLIIIAVILLGITYAQDAPIRGVDRGERNVRLDRSQDLVEGYALVEQGLAKTPKPPKITIGPNKKIQSAVDKASDGTLIILKAGTWTENVVIDSASHEGRLTLSEGE